MDTDYIALAVPVFLLLIAVEVLWARHRRRDYYRLNDSINDLSTGVIEQLALALLATVHIAGYLAIHAHLRIADLPADGVWTWVACFVGVDFLYYWFHRLSHEINFMWAAHVVHHQSEEYNLTVALRQSTVQPFMSMVFYWPLALLGFPPAVYVACAAFNTLYQFWIHTRLIGRMGPLEWIFMTPSHHRVHHGRNPIYIDRNHGGTFIFWDKLFGTFQAEEEEVVYGITKPLASWNPIWANLHYWAELFDAARRTARPIDRIRVFLKEPGWMPDDLGGFQAPPPVTSSTRRYDPRVDGRTRLYAVVQFAQVLALTVALMFAGAGLGWSELALGTALVCWGLVGLGGLLDRRDWAPQSEWLRLVVAPPAAWVLVGGSGGLILLAALALNLPLAWALGIRWRGTSGVPAASL